MIGQEIAAKSGADLIAFVRGLGKHRYVASRLHLVHAFAIEAAAPHPDLAEAEAWAKKVLSDPEIDRASKDERLHRRATDAEVVAVVTAFWSTSDGPAHARLRERLAEIGIALDAERLPFDEDAEEDVFPVLVDAGWELLPLAQLDAEKHKGAMQNFGDELGWQVAKFEEENAVPPQVHLHELPAIGPTELLHVFDEDGSLRAPFVVWLDGNETYQDYVLRGVSKVSKVDLG
jgi:hypothetical protein